MNKLMITYWVAVLSIGGSLIAKADNFQDLPFDQLVRKRAEDSINSAKSEQSMTEIPSYSEGAKGETAARLNNIDPASLEAAGAKLRDSEISKNPDGAHATISEATNPRRLKGFEDYHNLKMFQDADIFMKDPLSHMQTLLNGGCKELDNSKEKGFRKRNITETYTDLIEELRTCEAPITKFNCEKSLKVNCVRTVECDYGGIERDSVATDMTLDYSGGILTIGSIDDNNWDGQCKVYDRPTTFRTKNVHLIKQFRLIKVGFDDHIEVSLNGHIVYVGPYGGSKLEVVEREHIGRRGHVFKELTVNNGQKEEQCELGTSWVNDVNIDLKPFLREGENTLRIKVIVSNYGEGWVKIEAKQQCCPPENWAEEWLEDCSQGT
jgi:hypothetical protein